MRQHGEHVFIWGFYDQKHLLSVKTPHSPSLLLTSTSAQRVWVEPACPSSLPLSAFFPSQTLKPPDLCRRVPFRFGSPVSSFTVRDSAIGSPYATPGHNTIIHSREGRAHGGGVGGLLLGVSLKFDMQNSKLRLHADESANRGEAQSMIRPFQLWQTHTHKHEHKGSLCQSFADTSHDFCDVKLIKEKPRDWAGTAVYALCYATECEKHFLKPCQVKSTVRPADFSPWQLWETGAKNQT